MLRQLKHWFIGRNCVNERDREELETCVNRQAKKEKERETDTRGNEN